MNSGFTGSDKYTARVWSVVALVALCQACSPLRPVPEHVTDGVGVTPSVRGSASAASSRGVVPPASPEALAALLARSDNLPPARSILPEGLFGEAVSGRLVATAPVGIMEPDEIPARESRPSPLSLQQAPVVASALPVAVRAVTPPRVLVYASPTTHRYFAAFGIDYQQNISSWEDFLRRGDFQYEVGSNAEAITKSACDVVVLPSAISLTAAEREAVAAFRAEGGSVLSSWLTGVRGERGEWQGFGFMETTLDTQVLGNTEADVDDVYLIPSGGSPVSHLAPAGMRIWTERVQDWFPLRLGGAHSAADVMDWGRTVTSNKASSVMTFNERTEASGQRSRVIVLGFPERLWLSADHSVLEPIVHDALRWLTRGPDVYTAAWPWPYRSALVLAVDSADTMGTTDLRYARLAEELGGHASYFVLTEQAATAAPLLRTLQAGGHEVASLGDRFVAFKDQSAGTQRRRLDAMVAEMKGAGLDLGSQPGFRAPMESGDAVTQRLLQERGFGYQIVGPGASEARLPFIVEAAGTAKSMVVLPRTQNGPDDAVSEGDPVVGLKNFLAEFDRAEAMGGLNVIRIPNTNFVTDLQWGEIASHIKAVKKGIWTATAAQVAQWWQERDRVSVSLDDGVSPALLTVVISGQGVLREPVMVLANLPQPGAILRVVPDSDGAPVPLPKLLPFDAWRSALILDGLAPGTYHWFIDFENSSRAQH